MFNTDRIRDQGPVGASLREKRRPSGDEPRMVEVMLREVGIADLRQIRVLGSKAIPLLSLIVDDRDPQSLLMVSDFIGEVADARGVQRHTLADLPKANHH